MRASKRRRTERLRSVLGYVIFALIIVFAVLCFSGCKGVKEIIREVPVYVHDTTHTVKEVHDSTYVDRWHTIEIKGDSVIKHDSTVVFRYRTKTDTLLKYIEQPIPVTITEKEYVDKPLTWWQQTQMYGFWIFLACIAVVLAWRKWVSPWFKNHTRI